jgi:tetratricopeptide (TPR) repeat protein
VLKIGEECSSKKVTAYAYTWLPFPCYELGRYKEGIAFSEKGYELAKEIETDDYLYFKSLGGICNNSINLGNWKRCIEIGKELLAYGAKRSNTRATVVGHVCMGYGHQMRGDFQSAIESERAAFETSIDPFYSIWPLFALCFYYCWVEKFDKAYDAIKKVLAYCEEYGCKVFEEACKPFLGVPLMARGEFAKGMDLIESGLSYLREHDRFYFLGITEYIMGRVYLQITEGKGIADFSTAVKNIGFIASNVPFAAKKSEEHFNKALEVAEKTGASLVKSFTYLELARLHFVKGKKSKARECLDKAIKIFEENEADAYLEQARELFSRIG